MQVKEFEANSLRECLQQVRNALGPEAVILETRRRRRGGVLGMGARDAVCILAAVGITVQSELASGHRGEQPPREHDPPAAARPYAGTEETALDPQTSRGEKSREGSLRHPSADLVSDRAASARIAARTIYSAAAGRSATPPHDATPTPSAGNLRQAPAAAVSTTLASPPNATVASPPDSVLREAAAGTERLASLQRAMDEIRQGLGALQREQRETCERTVSAVVSAVSPAVSAAVQNVARTDDRLEERFPELARRLRTAGLSEEWVNDLLEELPDLSAWRPEARKPLAESVLQDLISRRVAVAGPITVTPGQLKTVALIGPTGVGKTTTIAKLAAHFALLESKRVALLTVDTYRIAAVEQLKTYSQIIGIPIRIAYSPAEVEPLVRQFIGYDLLLVDTAGRSQKHQAQLSELKLLTDSIACETHLVLSASTKEADMLDVTQRFSAVHVDRLIFSKLDETYTYGTLLAAAATTGIPLSYFTTGQRVPEDIEIADSRRLADLVLN